MELKARRVKHGWRYKITDKKLMIKVEGNCHKYKKEAREAAIKAYEYEIKLNT